MGINFLNLKLHQEFDRIKLLHGFHFFFLIMALLLEGQLQDGIISTLFKVTLITIFYRFYYLSVRKVYYSFWMMSFFTLLFIISGLFSSLSTYNSLLLFYLYLFACFSIIAQSYLLFSPIYYPIVRWWEYDFRYRDDLKIKVLETDGSISEGRLTDLRKNAGCVVSFQELGVGTSLEITFQSETVQYKFFIEIMSKSEYSIGRPPRYGVKFLCKTKEEEENFKIFSQYWNLERKYKNYLKFNIKKKNSAS